VLHVFEEHGASNKQSADIPSQSLPAGRFVKVTDRPLSTLIKTGVAGGGGCDGLPVGLRTDGLYYQPPVLGQGVGETGVARPVVNWSANDQMVYVVLPKASNQPSTPLL
jgi:hypothetical protein